MTELHACGAATGAEDRSRPRAVPPALCATQITSRGIVHYAFPVLNPQITADSGWSTGATTAASSLALVVSGLTGIRVGRIIDRRGPRRVMTAGSMAGVLSLTIVALAPNLPVSSVGRLLGCFAMAATFYQPAFAAALAAHLSWRETYLVLAVILAAGTIPVHAIALKAPWPPAAPSSVDTAESPRAREPESPRAQAP